MEWYIKADSNGESVNAKWVRAALIKNLQKVITLQFAVQLRQAQTIDTIYNLVMIHLHDHNIGLPRGQTPAKLYLTEDYKEETNQTKRDDKQEDSRQEQSHEPWINTYGDGSGDVNVVKGGKHKAKAKDMVPVGIAASGAIRVGSAHNLFAQIKDR